MPTPASLERDRFADALAEAGPDAPTLCEGWTTRDLAAHVVVRESRPDAAPGVIISAVAGYTEKVQGQIAEGAWDDLVATVRSGPPIWSPTRVGRIDRVVNTAEFFVHLEDVRRAGDSWVVRELDDDLADDLYGALKRSARIYARKAPAGITLEPDGDRAPIVARSGEPMVTVRGPVGELVLWINGRQLHAAVTYDGLDEAVEALRTAGFGI